MIIIKISILYFIQIIHNDDFLSTGTRLVEYNSRIIIVFNIILLAREKYTILSAPSYVFRNTYCQLNKPHGMRRLNKLNPVFILEKNQLLVCKNIFFNFVLIIVFFKIHFYNFHIKITKCIPNLYITRWLPGFARVP